MFTLVLPFHSDSEKLLRSLERIRAEADKWKITEILLCHNGIRLGKEEEESIRSKLWGSVRLLHTDRPGIGAGYKLGIQNATRDYVVLSASDLPFGFTDIGSFLKLHTYPEFAIGSKGHRGSSLQGYSLKRRAVSWAFYLLRRLFLGPSTPRDSQGTFIIRSSLAKKLAGQIASDDYFFSLELATLYLRSGGSITELPVVLENYEGESSVSLPGDSLAMGFNLVKLAFKKYGEKGDA